MMLAESTSPVSRPLIDAAFTECVMPRSSACTISSFASPAYPSLSARDLGAVCAFARTPPAANTNRNRHRNLRMFEISPHKKSRFRGGGRGPRVFHVRVEPIIHLPEHVQH